MPRKLATKVGVRVLVQVGGRAELLDAARVHHGDRVGHGHGLLLVVRDVHEGDADLGLDALELQLHLAAQLEVEGAERLVEEEHLGGVDQGSRDRHTLLLATRELVRLLTGLLPQLHELQHVLDLLLHRLDATPAQAEGDVLEDVEVREEGVGLEDGVHRPLVGRQPGDLLVAEVHGARGGLLQAGDHAKGGRLAAAGGAEQGEEGALGHGQVERLHRGEAVVVRLADAGEADVPAGLGGLVRHGDHAPVSFANFSSKAVSSFALRERKACDFAAMALSGMISGLFAASGSSFSSSGLTPSTGDT
ncbi:hypothetical protein RKD19_002447 [Streptomyces canus]